MEVFQVLEHGSLRIGLQPGAQRLSEAEVLRLEQVAADYPGLCRFERSQVTFAQFAGLICLGERMLEILPKVGSEPTSTETCRGILLRLLRISGALPTPLADAASQSLRSMPLLDLFISAYFDELARLARGGLMQRYVGDEQDLRVLRGQLDVRRQVGRLANRGDQLACRFDELSQDHACNRFLKKALRSLRPLLRAQVLSRRWVELMQVFDAVDDSGLSLQSWRDPPRDRSTRRYEPALQWAGWILRLLSPSLRGGDSAAPALLFDMNRLFEQAVGVQLRQTLAPSGLQLGTQDGGRHLAEVRRGDLLHPAYALRPDLVLRRGGAVVAIGDTKWKRLATGKGAFDLPARADAYQLFAYASAYRCSELALIYPTVAASQPQSPLELRLPVVDGRRVRLRVLFADVGDDLLPLLGSLGETLWHPAPPARAAVQLG
ncbi:MAG: hypothetical protein H4O13_14745 [Xanthomonadales bacterium]|nr:hypothetical protein [Xanthomonadales bacterium]